MVHLEPAKVIELTGSRSRIMHHPLFQRAAELQGRTLTDFVIASVRDAAVRVIEETQTMRLSAKDSRAFTEALLNPREPNARLKAAAQRYLKLVGG